MRYVRFEKSGASRFGILEGENISSLAGAPWIGHELSGETFHLGQVRLLAPVQPGNIFCVGLNYKDHAKEVGSELPEEPSIFLKGINSLLEPGGMIRIPDWAGRVDYEGELAVVIGKACRNVSEEEVPAMVFGMTCLNDITARELQKKDSILIRSKSFDTFCPIGPWIVDAADANGRSIVTRLNGRAVQSANTDMMIFSVPRLVSYISRFATLQPGDVIATGTPAGIGSLKAGDQVEVEIEGLGLLKNTCVADHS